MKWLVAKPKEMREACKNVQDFDCVGSSALLWMVLTINKLWRILFRQKLEAHS